ncbi:hypothetical protein RND81_06G128200 [Saponaria officinalis]|uniref:Uncharacterized protein n=1 Tax=Saponaria officinalis TaxID=3572 RepID=A0AAW1KCH1_SAPOF
MQMQMNMIQTLIMLFFILCSQVSAQIVVHDKDGSKHVVIWRPLIIIGSVVALAVVGVVLFCFCGCLYSIFSCLGCYKDESKATKSADGTNSPV